MNGGGRVREIPYSQKYKEAIQKQQLEGDLSDEKTLIKNNKEKDQIEILLSCNKFRIILFIFL